MRQETRRAFVRLRIAQPQGSFLTYPAPALLFRKMEPIQKEALRAMGGKGLLSIKAQQRGVAELTESGEGVVAMSLNEMVGVYGIAACEVPHG